MARLSSAKRPAACITMLMAILFHGASHARSPGCTRPIVVASSPVGRAMMIAADNTVQGAVKDFLDLVSERTGCTFHYTPVPRSRAWMMIEWGRADIMPAAAQSPERDQFAQFVQTHQVRPMLMSLNDHIGSMNSTADVQRSQLQVGVVRSYDFGPAYRKLNNDLFRQDRLHVVAEPQAIAQLLRSGRIDAAVIPQSAFADAGETYGLGKRLLWRPLADLPRVPIGFYLSTKILDDADRAVLHEAIRQAVASDVYGKAMRKHYPAWALEDIKGN